MKASQSHQSWTDVAVFESLSDGQVLEKFLMDHRLEARAYDDKFFRYFLFLRPPTITYRVQVRANAFRAAVELLDKSASAVLEKALHCPACGSLRVNYPQMTRKFFMPTVILHLGIIFRFIEHECYCENCHHIWNLTKEDVGTVHETHTAKPFPF